VITRARITQSLRDHQRLVALGALGTLVLGVLAWQLLRSHGPRQRLVAITYRLVATSDDGQPLADVALELNGKPMAKTDERGELTLPLRGRLGALVPFAVKCPATHAGAPTIPPVVLRPQRAVADAAAAPPTQAIESTVVCDRSVRRAAVLVRVQHEIKTIHHNEGGGTTESVEVAPLVASISLDGDQVATIEESGVAHLALERPPGTKLELEVTPDSDDLDSFAMPFEVGEVDDVYVLERTVSQTVETRAVRKKSRAKRPSKRAVQIKAIPRNDAPFLDL
jgi:hypothetical protein